jgi:hypothetical protein
MWLLFEKVEKIADPSSCRRSSRTTGFLIADIDILC